jgi:hypothetical protein
MEILLGLLALISLPWVLVVGGLVTVAANENGVGPLLPLPLTQPAAGEAWCERSDLARGHERHPVFVPPTDPRSEVTQDVDVLACRTPLVRPGARAPLADALLFDLGPRTDALTALAVPFAARPGRVFVEAFTPDPALSQKVATAARTALAAQGLAVQRLAPVPAAADVEVMRAMPVADALPWSCRRLAADGQLGENDLFVALAVVDPLETALHVGACAGGRFVWLQ